jgi:hypothetical protein
MIRPLIIIIIIILPFLIIASHKNHILQSDKKNESNWNKLYLVFLVSYVLFVFYLADVF